MVLMSGHRRLTPEKDGKVLTDSEQVGQWGAPTLDVWVVRKDFAEKHPEVVKAFAKAPSMLSNRTLLTQTRG